MKDNPEFNVEFVSIIRKNPAVYDFTSEEYSKRNLQDEAWEKISMQLNESIQDCKERWKNLRGSYTRHLKYKNTPAGRKKKPYYLAEHLTFLTPFTKSRPMKSNLFTRPSDADPGNSESELDNNDEFSSIQYKEEEDVNKSEYFEHTEALNQINFGQFDEDPDVLFLMSLLPDMKKMSDSQKRRYKIEMLSSAGNILDEKAESLHY